MEKIKEIEVKSGEWLRKWLKAGQMVTLPKPWVKDIKLKAGDKIEIYREDEALIIKPSRAKKEK